MNSLATVNKTTKLTINDVRQYLCPKADDKEIFQFIKLCESQGLNPWIREAYLIKYKDSTPATMVVGKDVFTKRAQNHPGFSGFEAGIIVDRNGEIIEIEGSFSLEKDKLLGGWAKVYVKGYEVPITAKVSMKEYGQQYGSWKKIPATMIRKVPLVQALREAFPDVFTGLYDSTEMGVDDTKMDDNIIDGEVVEDKPEDKKEPKKDPPKTMKKEAKKTETKNAPPKEDKTKDIKAKDKDPRARCVSGMGLLKFTAHEQDILMSAFETDFPMLLDLLIMVKQGKKNAADLVKEAEDVLGVAG